MGVIASGEAVIVSDEVWLETMWQDVHPHLPPAPARVLEVGCGPLGGFVPSMRAAGYDAVGVDPEAPEGPEYARLEFERHPVTEPVDAVVASASLHHVDALDVVLDKLASALVPGGAVVVIEWAHERFDEATAQWCFERLDGSEHSWLGHHREQWLESGQTWDGYFRSWIGEEHLHAGADIVRSLQQRFEEQAMSDAPFFFADLAGVTKDDEQAAIDAGLIRPGGLLYVGRRRGSAVRAT